MCLAEVLHVVRRSSDGLLQKIEEISKAWFPDCTNGAILDQVYDDFDAQSERLVGHDQLYFQLSPGRFVGRFASGFLGPDVSVHIEAANQALEQLVGSPRGGVTLGLVLGPGAPFSINGQACGRDEVFVVPGGSELMATSPPAGVVMAVALSQAVLARVQASSALRAVLEPPRAQVSLHRQPALAASLRQVVFAALDRLAMAATDIGDSPDQTAAIGSALASSLCGLMDLYQIGDGLIPLTDNALLLRAKQAVLHDLPCALDIHALARQVGCSERSLQALFARHVHATPSAWMRRVRLTMARREILHPTGRPAPIGDLAARFGFWNWSRFSAQYRAQFGELPSQTRRRAQS